MVRYSCHGTGIMTSIMASADGTTVRRARLARALTQDELARRAGLSRQALGAIEAGAYQPGVGAALALARELGESVEALFGAPVRPALLEADWAEPRDASAFLRALNDGQENDHGLEESQQSQA